MFRDEDFYSTWTGVWNSKCQTLGVSLETHLRKPNNAVRQLSFTLLINKLTSKSKLRLNHIGEQLLLASVWIANFQPSVNKSSGRKQEVRWEFGQRDLATNANCPVGSSTLTRGPFEFHVDWLKPMWMNKSRFFSLR